MYKGYILDVDTLRAHPASRPVSVSSGAQAQDGRSPAHHRDASRTREYDEQALKRVWHYLARFGYAESE